jgi:hypothetical protein
MNLQATMNLQQNRPQLSLPSERGYPSNCETNLSLGSKHADRALLAMANIFIPFLA